MELDTVASPVAQKYLRLQSAKNVGPVCARKLIERFGSIDAVFAASVRELERVPDIGRGRAKGVWDARGSDNVGEELVAAARSGVRVICREDPDYPKLLAHICDPPVCLYVRGQLQPEDGVAVAVVGSRRCSHYGLEQAHRFGALLAQAGFTVVSGMARGADSAAHRGALEANGRTVAVMGNGLGHIYPPEHADLADEIAANGAVISELPMDTAPDAKNFPPRNRIIIGLALGVIVVEAGKPSGALITARLATEYNREVFAVPGRVDNPRARGTNALIRDGAAKLITCLEDVLDELGDVGRIMRPNADETEGLTPAPVLDEAERAIFDIITVDDTSLEHICNESKLSPAVVATTLTKLQMKGLIRQRPGNVFVRSRSV